MRIKIIEYNVLTGFHTDDENQTLETQRLEAAKRVIAEASPDILILTEACDHTQNEHKAQLDYKREFNMPYHYHGCSGTTHKHGNSVLSRFPIIKAENYSMDKRKHVRVALNIAGKVLHLDAVHPHPNISENERARFMHSTLRDIQTPYILAGDFNSWSPDDAPKNLEDVIKRFKEFPNLKDHPEWAEKAVRDLATCQAVKEVKKHGLIDTHIERGQTGYTIPTNLLSKDKSSSARLDYIFCSPDIKVIDAGIIKNADTEIASDHHPVYAVLEI